MRWPVRSSPGLLSVVFFFVEVSCTPNCRRDAARFSNDSPVRRIGHGFDQFQDDGSDGGFTEPVLHLTASNNYIDLPVSRLRLAVPCESGPGNFHTNPGKPAVSFDLEITSHEQFAGLIEQKSAFVVDLTDLLADLERMKKAIISDGDEVRSIVLSYRAYEEAQVSLGLGTAQTWWSESFAKVVDELENSSASHPSYHKLISRFGTHYVSQVAVGAYRGAHASIQYCDSAEDAYIERGNGGSFDRVISDLAFLATFKGTTISRTEPAKPSYAYPLYKAGLDRREYLRAGRYDEYSIPPVKSTDNHTVLARKTLFKALWTLLPVDDIRSVLLKKAITDYTAGRKRLKPTTAHLRCSACDCGFSPRMSILFSLLAASYSYFVC